MPRKPTCECGKCRTCYMREARRRFYEKHRQEIIRQNTAAKRARVNRSPEVSDEELDRRALVMMGRLEDAR